jgi:hypothetical protein
VRHDIRPYMEILTKFNNSEISIEDFEEMYLSHFKAEKRIFPDDIYNLLNEIFTSIDMHVFDKYGYSLAAGELNDEMLVKRVGELYMKLSLM